MFITNSIVEQDSVLGRVLFHDTIKRKVYVLVRTGDHSWKMQKWEDNLCHQYMSYLWHIETAFATKFNKSHSTPLLDSMEIEQDIHVLYLNR